MEHRGAARTCFLKEKDLESMMNITCQEEVVGKETKSSPGWCPQRTKGLWQLGRNPGRPLLDNHT